MHQNNLIASGTTVIVAAATPVTYVGLVVVTASDLVYKDGNGATTTLTAAPVGLTIACQITVVSTCSGVVLGYNP